MSSGLKDKPKDFQNGISIFCPKQIFDQFDFNKEVREINKSGRLSRKIKVDTLRINFMLLVNFLSNNIPTNESCHFKYIQSTTLRKYGSDKYYRICIDMLKRSGFLYIKSYNKGVETYSVGNQSKGYRWNKSKEQMNRMTLCEIKVHDFKTKKKIMENVEMLQCFKYCKKCLTKVTRKVSKYKRPRKFNSGKSGQYFWKDVKYLRNWYENTIYMTSKMVKFIDNRKKYALQHHLFSAYGMVIRLKYYKKLDFERLQTILQGIRKRIYYYTGDYYMNNVDFRKFYDKSHVIHKIFAECGSQREIFLR